MKRFVDLMALYKLNRLHLHLSDDQGWRIAISKWPRLATHGGATAVGGGKGGYYTQAQYSDIVRYAAARYVVVVPEIDMPGHVHAALSSYPKLACDGKPSPLYTGIERRLQLALHRQDDHVRLRLGRRRRARTADARPVDPHRRRRGARRRSSADYVRFVERVQAIVASYGKHMIGWEEVGRAKLDALDDRPALEHRHDQERRSPHARCSRGRR